MSLVENLAVVDRLIADLGDEPPSESKLHKVQNAVCRTIQSMCSGKSDIAVEALSDKLERARNDPQARRDAALLVLRCLGTPGVIAENDDQNQLQRRVVALVEQGAPDFAEFFKLKDKKQTIDKFNILQSVHRYCWDLLSPMRIFPIALDIFAAYRQEVFKALNHSMAKAYFNNYGFSETSSTVRSICTALYDLQETRDASFGKKLQAASELIAREIGGWEARTDCFATGTYLPFLRGANALLRKIDDDANDRMECELEPRRRGGQLVERRYRLHEADRDIRVQIPLMNSGPGIAAETTAHVVSVEDSVAVNSSVIDIGSVPPGEFSLAFEMYIVEPIAKVTLMIELQWRTMRSTEARTTSFDVTLHAQNPCVDWEALARVDPYSTEVAYGDEFVGRRGKTVALATRLLKDRMQCSFITGQKRVGKTSLAYAVIDYVNTLPSPRTFEFSYLEYGDYSRKDADATVEELGRTLAQRLLPHLPPEMQSISLDFRGSLAPLNMLSDLLNKMSPAKRFIIVLDEFDEIHPEMYRYGALADAFFSNLRTLSAKRNVALILVGGENMPFIMGAQGDQLNKFVHEPLDYFSRAEEWDDFVALAQQKSVGPLNWYESALTELFNYTNGHPYYTKLICSRILHNAVNDRDTEITTEEVRRAVNDVVDVLEPNAFAHLWKDGIPARSREEAEIIALKRCRVLVAIARTLRENQALTAERVIANKHSAKLDGPEVRPILDDFCRRDVLKEKGGVYEFLLPLFQLWLVHKGMNKLISDTLGDEMADAFRRAEDEACVTPQEIAALLERWPAYRGRKKTADDVRAWLDQRPSFQDQRILFKILRNVRFVTEDEVREKLRTAHSIVKSHTSPFTPRTRSERRYDLIITYVDGVAKSGQIFAGRYADENLISVQCVIDAADFGKKVIEYEEKRHVTVSGVVVIDDIAATGEGLSTNVIAFLQKNATFLRDRNITIVVVVLMATKQADERIRSALSSPSGIDVDLRICELIRPEHYAFSPETRIWSGEEERAKARALISELGRQIYPDQPFGYGNLGLLVVFPETCPNNSLPILHATGSGGWQPLFPRPKN